MAQRDQFVGALGGLDAGDPRGAKHVALFRVALAHDGKRLRLHDHAALGYGLALGDRFCRNIDHAGFAAR